MSDRPSTRRQIINRFANFITANRLANPFDGEVYHPNPRYYAVDFAIPALEGTVQVYGPRFILILLRGSVSGERVYATSRNAMEFLRLLLVEHNTVEALAVPTKPSKEA